MANCSCGRAPAGSPVMSARPPISQRPSYRKSAYTLVSLVNRSGRQSQRQEGSFGSMVSSLLTARHCVVSGVTIAIPTRGPAVRRALRLHHPEPASIHRRTKFNFYSPSPRPSAWPSPERAMRPLRKLAAFAQLNPNPALEFAADGPHLLQRCGPEAGAVHRHRFIRAKFCRPGIGGIVRTALQRAEANCTSETNIGGRTFSWSFHPMLPVSVVHCYVEDITDA